MINTTMVHEFPALAPRAKVHLVDHGTELLKMFFDKGHAYAARILEKDGVELRLGVGVKAIGPGHVTLSDGTHDQDPLRHLGRRPDGRADRRRQRAAAGPRRPDRCRARTSRSPGSRASWSSAISPTSRPRTARPIRSSARWRCRAGRRPPGPSSPTWSGKQAKPFSYLDKGTMAMIGRGAAIAQVKGVELHGKIAFAAWLGVHAALMTGGSNRVGAFKSWAMDFFGKDRAPQALDRSGTPRMAWEDDVADEPVASGAATT